MIPNATAEMLASQARIRRRAALILARRHRRYLKPHQWAMLDELLVRRPDLADMRAPGAVLAESATWAA